MKKLLFILWVNLIFSCNSRDTAVAVNDGSLKAAEDFDWLVGSWERMNGQEGQKTFEHWIKNSNSGYKGFAFTLQNNDTIWQENVSLVKSGTGWNFEVTGEGETMPTIFKLTKTEKGRFTCENQENEFPNIISYFKNGDKMKAVISGAGMEIPFEFEKVVPNRQ